MKAQGRNFTVVVVAVLLTLAAGARPEAAAQPVIDEDAVETVDAHLAARRGLLEIPGMAAVVVANGEVVLANGYGVTRGGDDDPMTADTPLLIASLGKNLTGLAVGQLVDDGVVAFDDPVSQYVPELAPEGDAVTLAELVHHLSGIDRSSDFSGWSASVLDEPADLDRLRAQLEPDAAFEYANVNYDLLALVVQRASGHPFGDWMADRVFTPLGMDTTSAQPDAVAASDVASGHYDTMLRGFVPHGPERPPPGTAASYGTVSTATDMARILQVHLQDGEVDGETIVTPATLAWLHEPDDTTPDSPVGYAGGLWAQPVGVPGMPEGLAETSMLWHDGGSVAYRSELRVLPEQGVGVVLLANANDVTDQSLLGQVAWETVWLLAGLEIEPLASTSPWLVRWSKQLLLAMVMLQALFAVAAVTTLRRVVRGDPLRPWRDRGLLVASTLLDVTAALLLAVVVPSQGDVPTTFLLQLPDYRVLIGAMGLGIAWGVVRTMIVTTATLRRAGRVEAAA